MLGKKKFLWTNVLLAIVYLAIYFTTILWWNEITRSSLPNNMGTAFFYYAIMSTIFGWYTSHWAVALWRWNWKRYEYQYESEANAFIYHYVEVMDHKLSRYREFKELRDLLKLATKMSKAQP
jgi:hypothetical protein